jgi:hypothetical protein
MNLFLQKGRVHMSFENGNGLSAADMAAVLRGGNGGFGGDGSGYGGWWIILFFLICMMGGWGNNGWGNNGNGGGAPYVAADMQRGFDQQATTGQISALQAQVGNGFADAAVARCQGNANITAAVTNSQFGVTNAVNGAKDVLANGMNQLAMGLQNCCCENRAGLADLKYTVATENCADRQALSDGLRDVMAQATANTNAIVQSQNQGFQNVLDKLCQLELDNVKQENERLRTQLNLAGLAASQTAQTAQILQGQNMQAQNVISSCCPKPVPAYVVANPNGCGCGGYGGCGV